MRQVPVADAVVRRLQLEAQRALLVGAGDEGQRFVQRVAQPGVDVPTAVGAVLVRQVVDHQHEVVGERVHARPVRSVHPADVAGHAVAERVEQE